jgi:hypothetical protein
MTAFVATVVASLLLAVADIRWGSGTYGGGPG